MTKGQYVRCNITEFDMGMWCNRKSAGTSWLHEPYYTERTYINLCKSHLAWINRPESDYDIDYDKWIEKA